MVQPAFSHDRRNGVQIYLVTETVWRDSPAEDVEEEAEKCLVSAHTSYEDACTAAVARFVTYAGTDYLSSSIGGWDSLLPRSKYLAMTKFFDRCKRETGESPSRFRVEPVVLYSEKDKSSPKKVEQDIVDSGKSVSDDSSVKEVGREEFLRSSRKRRFDRDAGRPTGSSRRAPRQKADTGP